MSAIILETIEPFPAKVKETGLKVRCFLMGKPTPKATVSIEVTIERREAKILRGCDQRMSEGHHLSVGYWIEKAGTESHWARQERRFAEEFVCLSGCRLEPFKVTLGASAYRQLIALGEAWKVPLRALVRTALFDRCLQLRLFFDGNPSEWRGPEPWRRFVPEVAPVIP